MFIQGVSKTEHKNIHIYNFIHHQTMTANNEKTNK